MSNEETIWIRRTDEIPTANMASLRRSLMTCDGMDVKIKGPALDEIIRRVREEERAKIAREEMGL
jgi:hypothetical protein